jgi:CDP-diacylglycerol--glycerol-3-phosphate 3-phosphatidyltransferase
MKREFLTISNLLSIFRGLLSIPFALVMLVPADPMRFLALGILLIGMLTDFLDGRIARARGEETEWGKILDPLADKVCVAVMALVLLKLGDLPFWFVAALIARDLAILAGGVYIKSARGVVLPSNTAGK